MDFNKFKAYIIIVVKFINKLNIKFNLLSNLVPLISLYRQIPIGKTFLFIEKKPIFR